MKNLLPYVIVGMLGLIALPAQAKAGDEPATETQVREGCSENGTNTLILQTYQAGETGFANRNLEMVQSASIRARTQIVPCMIEVIDPETAGAFHRLMAFEAFLTLDDERAISELRASRRVQPAYQFPEQVAPTGHPLLEYYERAAEPIDQTLQPVYAPAGGTVYVDGIADAGRPTKVPVIVQVTDPDGVLMETAYVQPGDTLPRWGINPLGVTAEDLGITRGPNLKNPVPWYIAGAGAVIVSGVFYGVAKHHQAQFVDTSGVDGPGSQDALENHANLANGFGTASIATGAVGLGLLTVGTTMHIRFGRGHKTEVSVGGVPVNGGDADAH